MIIENFPPGPSGPDHPQSPERPARSCNVNPPASTSRTTPNPEPAPGSLDPELAAVRQAMDRECDLLEALHLADAAWRGACDVREQAEQALLESVRAEMRRQKLSEGGLKYE